MWMPIPVKKTSASEYLVKSPALSVATKNEIVSKPAVETVVKSTPSPAPSGGGGSPAPVVVVSTPAPAPAPVVIIEPPSVISSTITGISAGASIATPPAVEGTYVVDTTTPAGTMPLYNKPTITPSKAVEITLLTGYEENIKPTEAKNKFGYIPPSGVASKAIADVETQITASEAELKREQLWKYEYEKQKPVYEQNKEFYQSSIKNIKGSEPTSQWWIDVNQNMVQDADEIFGRDVAAKKLETDYNQMVTNWESGDFEKTYENISSNIKTLQYDTIPKLRAQQKIFIEYQKEGYAFTKTKEGYDITTPSSKEVYESIYPGALGTSRIVAQETRSFGLSKLFSEVTGTQSAHEEQTYNELLNLTQTKQESGGDYLKRVFVSPEAAMDIYIPAVTLGAGYAVKGLSMGGKAVGVGRTTAALSEFGTTGSGKALNVGIKTTLAGAGVVGTASMAKGLYDIQQTTPELLPSALGKTAGSLIVYAGAYKTGEYLFSRKVPEPLIVGGKQVLDIDFVDRQITGLKEPSPTFGKEAVNVFQHGKKPGTGTLYQFEAEMIGRGGKPISKVTSLSESYGLLYERGGKKPIGTFEAYGKTTKIGESLSMDKTISGTYGKNPDVSVSYGFSGTKQLGRITKNITTTADKGFTGEGKIPYLLKKTTPTEFDVYATVSEGKIFSKRFKGNYRGITETAKIVGEKTNTDIFKEARGEVSSGGGLNKIKLLLDVKAGVKAAEVVVNKTSTPSSSFKGGLTGSTLGSLSKYEWYQHPLGSGVAQKDWQGIYDVPVSSQTSKIIPIVTKKQNSIQEIEKKNRQHKQI